MRFNPMGSAALMLAICATVSWSGTPDSYSATEFSSLNGDQVGRAKNDNVIELTYSPGVANLPLVGQIAYSHIVGEGSGEIQIPISFPINGGGPYFTSPNAIVNDTVGVMLNSKTWGFGFGLKYRKFQNHIEEGLFYGGGIRVYIWDWTYEKGPVSHPSKFADTLQTFAPMGEAGYIWRLAPQFYALASGELGVQLHTLDPDQLGDEKYKIQFNQSGHPDRFIFYTVNLGLRYGF